MYGILLTAYKDVNQVYFNIENFRKKFKSPCFQQCPIVVTFTSETPLDLSSLQKFNNIFPILIPNAPGSIGSNFKLKVNHSLDWRARFLTARNFLALEKGLQKARRRGVKTLLHLHSDTFWNPEAEGLLLQDLEFVDMNFQLFMGDTTDYEPSLGRPSGWLPEGLIFNLPRCKWLGFDRFTEIYNTPNSQDNFVSTDHFHTHDWIGFEAILGQWAEWCLTRRHVLDCNTDWSQDYTNTVEVRCQRAHHGTFEHLMNLGGTQAFGDQK